MPGLHFSPRITESHYKERGQYSHLKELGVAVAGAAVSAAVLARTFLGVGHDAPTPTQNPAVKTITAPDVNASTPANTELQRGDSSTSSNHKTD